ncbi:MAG: hypothetical protein ABI665_11320 [Vicinamibacterales bacterium]
MNFAELAAASMACWLASIIVFAYGMDAVGLTISPWLVLAGSLVTTGVCAGRMLGKTTREVGPLVVWAAVVSLVFAWLLRLAWPALLPPGKGPDLTHHLLLIDYIERHWRLAHDPALGAVMGEMAHYTPGAHLLAVLFGAWTRTDGFRVVYPLVSFTVALTAGFVFLITLRIASRRAPLNGVPLALIAVLLMVLPRAYVVDAFAHDSYLAQVVSTLFAVAMWWAILVWDDAPSPAAALLIGVMALGVFLAWPVWIGPPLLAFVAWLRLRRDLPLRARAQHLAIAVVPVAMLALVHAVGRWGWMAIVGTSGAVLHPSFEAIGWAFPLLALAGIAVSLTDRRARITLLLVAAIVAQAVALYVMALTNHAPTPYMTYKMGYLLIYPLAVLGALSFTRVPRSAAWATVAIMGVLVVRPLLAVPKPVPVVSRDFYDAGQWTRANVGSSCVDYLVADAYTAYWLHLAVLGNPRASARTAEVDQHDGRAAIARWIPAEGLPYAIADMTLLPDEIRARVTLLKQFGHAGVIARPGAIPCLPGHP